MIVLVECRRSVFMLLSCATISTIFDIELLTSSNQPYFGPSRFELDVQTPFAKVLSRSEIVNIWFLVSRWLSKLEKSETEKRRIALVSD